jgi:1-acyl-sn-glycerol-3-phosphate acyltransferase
MIYSAPIRSFFRLLIYVCWILVSIPVQAAALVLRSRLVETYPLIVHRFCVRLMGAKLRVKGGQLKQGGVLFVANHCSYVDISIIGSLIRGSFVAKSEVAGWPLFGICAKLSRTMFVDRRARFAHQQAELMKDRFRRGDRLIMFAEGTTSDGNRVLPFRSSLFATAEIDINGQAVQVQPVSISYTRLDGIPIGRHLRPFFAWYGDMDMFSHLWALVGMGRIEVVVEFHEPVTIRQFSSRKALAAYCQSQVAAGVAAALSGKPQVRAAPAIATEPPAPFSLPQASPAN